MEKCIGKITQNSSPPNSKILRISFDSLDDDTVKNIFLDIACFLSVWTKNMLAKYSMVVVSSQILVSIFSFRGPL
jgi:hypothetical protein